VSILVAQSLALQSMVVFWAGFLAALSPCVYPMLPITLGYFGTQVGTDRHAKILLYVLGQSFTLAVLGMVVVWAGETLGFTSESPWINGTIGIFLLLVAVMAWRGRMPAFLERWNNLQQRSQRHSMSQAGGGDQKQRRGYGAAFLVGASSALMASPCTTPILSGVLATMATAHTWVQGVWLMILYSIGFSSLFLMLGLGLMKLVHLPRSGRWLTVVHRVSAVLLGAAGVYYMSKV
jgi:thiol:disulfide interchange protein DsbD